MRSDSRSSFLETLRLGAYFSAAALLLCLVGLVEKLDNRDILAGVISLGQTFLVVIAVMAGYLASSRQGKDSRAATLFSLLAGGEVGAFLGLLFLLGNSVNLREVLINASPALYGILSLGLPASAVFPGLVALGALLGALGGLLERRSPPQQRAILQLIALIAFLGVLQDLLRVIVTNLGLLPFFRWMFGSGGLKGLSIPGAAAVAAVYGLARWLRGRIAQRQASRPPIPQTPVRRLLPFVLLGAMILIGPWILGTYVSEVFNSVGLFILMGLGLNIVVGFAGLLDLGYVAFFAIGAYAMGVLTTTAVGVDAGQIVWGPHLNFWEVLPLAILLSVFAGLVLGIPVLRMRGDYLAIVTLGFGEIVRIMALSDFLKPYIGGSQGIVEVGPIGIGPISFAKPQTLFYIIFAGCLLVGFIATRLKDSRVGRAWMAMREDEDVAQAVGLNLVATKLLAFATGAAFSGLGGAIFASKLGTIYPHSFALLVSINILAIVIVGGMGSIPGVVVGAFALVGLPELLREFADYRLFVYGAVLIGMMLLRPEGLLPEEARRRELHEERAKEALAEPGA